MIDGIEFTHRFAAPITLSILGFVLALHVPVVVGSFGLILAGTAAVFFGEVRGAEFLWVVFAPLLNAMVYLLRMAAGICSLGFPRKFGMVGQPLPRLDTGRLSQMRIGGVFGFALCTATCSTDVQKTVVTSVVAREMPSGLRQNLFASIATLHTLRQYFAESKRRKAILQTSANLAFRGNAVFAAGFPVELGQKFGFAANLATLQDAWGVDHLRFSFAGFAIEGVDEAAKQAVRAGYKAALVHTSQIISLKELQCL